MDLVFLNNNRQNFVVVETLPCLILNLFFFFLSGHLPVCVRLLTLRVCSFVCPSVRLPCLYVCLSVCRRILTFFDIPADCSRSLRL